MFEISKELFAIAKHLHESGCNEGSELKFRSAINRAYYSVFLLAREKTGLKNVQHDVHNQVLSAIYEKLRRTGDFSLHSQIKNLRSHRSEADYNFPSNSNDCADWKNCAENDVIKAGFALKRLNAL